MNLHDQTLSLGPDVQLQPASPVEPLPAARLDISLDGQLDFETTADLRPLDHIIGQDRALEAFDIGLGVRQEGYHIFVGGLAGTGKKDTIRLALHKRTNGPVPGDWVYVNNFDNPDEPWALQLETGQGRRFKRDMEQLIEQLREALPKAFRQEEFSREKDQLTTRYQEELQSQIRDLERRADQHGFSMKTGPEGQVFFIPLIEGEPIKSEEEYENLSEREKQRVETGRRELQHDAQQLLRQQNERVQQLTGEVREIERRFTAAVVSPMIETLKRLYTQPRAHEYLDRVAEHVLENLQVFRQGQESNLPPQLAMMAGQAQPRFSEYQVNLLVDNSHCKSAPVIVEDAPTYRNLFGAVERTTDQAGRLVTDFTQIKAGALLRANGGYLIFDLEDALTEPLVYKNLKRALKSRTVQLSDYQAWLPFMAGGIRPEPIPITTKVIVLGSTWMYYLLRYYDEEFGRIFKVRADFGTEMPRGPEPHRDYARFVAMITQQEDLSPFHRDAVVEIIRFGARKAGHENKLYTRFSEIADLIREADFFARKDHRNVVNAEHVRRALRSRIFRTGRIAEKIRELIAEGVLLVDTEGRKVGQVNGLAVADVGDFVFGRPSRVTASVGLGSDGVVNIERESRLSGQVHDKGVLILGGYLRNRYGSDKPLALSASITFEQTYGPVEGDSASSTELYVLLSRLSGIPLRQDIAVTGSVNQWGQVQAVGGLNEKIEGFYDVCATVGLTGSQGVCIPASNVPNVILRDDVRTAVDQGRFHLYAVETIDQGLELLTGIKAGDPSQENTTHWLIDRRLREMAQQLRGFGLRQTAVTVPSEQELAQPHPPRLPEDQP